MMTYNEYWQAIDAGFKPEDLVVFNYTDFGSDLLEDGLYVIGILKGSGLRGQDGYFVRASMKGAGNMPSTIRKKRLKPSWKPAAR